MNEADISNNKAVMESLNSSANSLQPEQAICPFYSVVPSENNAIAKLPLLKPAEDEQDKTPDPNSSTDTTQKDWVVEPESDQQKLVNAEFQKLLALNEELRSANNELYQQVEHLRDDLTESEKALQWQKRRSGVTESMLNQQSQELAAAQEQIQSLFQQLETASQTTQRQEILIESYKAQLQISQQRLAQLERECAILQTNYSEQSQQVIQSENACRELRTRLMRQQRQTLQFKAALEKSLETSIPNYDFPETNNSHSGNTNSHKTRFARKARSLFPNAQPIQPWSAEPETPEAKSEPSWEEPSTPKPFTSDYSAPNPPSVWNWPVKNEGQEDIRTISQPIESTPKEDEPPTTPQDAPSVGSAELDQQIDSLIQMFFASQPSGVSPTPSTSEAVVESQSVDTTVWETSVTNVDEEETPEEPLTPTVEVSPFPTNSLLSFTLSPTEKTAAVPKEHNSTESPMNEEEFSLTDLAPDSFDDSTNDTQSPSPVVYPQRQRKGLKSLASVELPNFNKPNGQQEGSRE